MNEELGGSYDNNNALKQQVFRKLIIVIDDLDI